MGELANCERCNRVFVKQFREICNECYKKEEEDFRTVYNFFKKTGKPDGYNWADCRGDRCR